LATDFFVVKGRLGGGVGAGRLPNRVHIASQHAILADAETFVLEIPFKFIALQHCRPKRP